MKKVRGFFSKFLILDCETSGLFKMSHNPCRYNPEYPNNNVKYYQAVSWGLMVCDTETLKIIDKMYVEIKWNQQSEWDASAEKVHGLTREYLEHNGISEQDAVLQIGNFLLKYWDVQTQPIVCCGHNVHFDLAFFRDLFYRFDIHLKIANRVIDTNSIAFGSLNTFNSDDAFASLNIQRDDQHNALFDAYCCWKILKHVRKVRLEV
jgi:DNA polymerase III epsilon subunit-like protein